MIFVSPFLFWLMIAVGAICLFNLILLNVIYKQHNKVVVNKATVTTDGNDVDDSKEVRPLTKKHQEIEAVSASLYRTLFSIFFLGFLIFGFTPVFLWLLFL